MDDPDAAPVAAPWVAPPPEVVRKRLDIHLRTWLGSWPPRSTLDVVGRIQRTLPGWDGEVHRLVGVSGPEGGVLSVPPPAAAMVRAHRDNFGDLQAALRAALGVPGGQLFQGTFRWSEQPVDLPDAGVWLPVEDPRLPAWLLPFGGTALVALDAGGRYMAGVGIKRHDSFGMEIAVGTDAAYEGRGLGRRLVAQAARAILDWGAVPTYLHDDANLASARVARAAGFPDRGWRIFGFREE